MTPEQRLEELGLVLPPATSPKQPDGGYSTGRLGLNVDIARGYADARTTGLQLLSTAKLALGDLSRIEAVVKLLGMVNAEADFGDHPKVINGCSDLFADVLGDAGKHARSAIGVGSLPGHMTVEIEAIFLVRPA
jgi:enamine deaminase RidA (YjgF/YER057c/UK114 family)